MKKKMSNQMHKEDGRLILADGQYFSMNSYDTKINNNVLIVGTTGAGKTRSIVSPNILQASGSYIVVDPKGNLYGKYKEFLEKKGYTVLKLNFAEPGDPESESYNYFHYIHSEQDIVKISHMLTYIENKDAGYRADPFWDEAAVMLLSAINAYLYERSEPEYRTLKTISELVTFADMDEDCSGKKTKLDYLFDQLRREKPDCFAVRQYDAYRLGAGRTLKSILITLQAKLSVFTTKDHNKLLAKDTVDIHSIGQKKSALFVVVSDTDRSNDPLANIFFTQAMNELCSFADHQPDHRLPVDVRFILDDFATNVRINDFPRMISSIRSRGISCMLMIQAESQLDAAYGHDGKTIIGNCDNYVYLGGNDVETAEHVARRCDRPLSDILYMPVETNWIFRRGQSPIQGKNFRLEEFEQKEFARVKVGQERTNLKVR